MVDREQAMARLGKTSAKLAEIRKKTPAQIRP